MDPNAVVPDGFAPEPPPTAFATPPSGAPEGYDDLPPPEGFQAQNPLTPAKTTTDEKPNTEVPGFWSSVGSAYGRGAAQRAVDDLAGTKVALPPGVGGKSLEEQYQEGLLHPETQDEINTLLGKKVNDGWTDPKWWGTQIAHGMGGMTTSLGAAAPVAVAGAGGGALIGGPAGAGIGLAGGLIAGLGAEGGLGALVPSYKKARAEGLSPEDATHRALIDSGISAATATAMGLAPMGSVFGKVANPAITDQVALMLRRPVMEMLAQLGVVQPSLAVTGEIVKDLSHGETPDPWGVATTYVVGAAQGVPIVGAHSAMSAVRTMRSRAVPSEQPASPEQVQQSFENQVPTPEPVPLERPSAPEGFVANEMDVTPREERIFFSPLKVAAEQRLPESASVDQVIATLRNSPGVKEEEILDLGLPSYLATVDGKVNKKDLLAYIDSESVKLEEVRLGDTFAENSQNDKSPQFAGQVLPGEHSNYREFLLKTPVRNEPSWARIEERAREIWDYNYESTFGPWDQAGESSRRQMMEKAKAFFFDEDPRVYTGSHWNDPNVVVHMRMTDRTGRNGEVLLHVEEIQSDLHQAGRKRGYLEEGFVPIDLKKAENDVTLTESRYMALKNARQRVDAQRAVHDARREGTTPPSENELRLRNEWRAAIDRFQEGVIQRNEMAGKLPNLPFKTSWQELAVKRVLRLAADEGYDGVSWSNGDQVGLRLATPEQLAGARQSYDKVIPSFFAKWAKKMGMDIDSTRFAGVGVAEALDRIPLQAREMRSVHYANMGLTTDRFNDRVNFVKLNPAAGSRIRQGLPLYETGVEGAGSGGISLNQAIQKGNPRALKQHIEPIIQILGQLGKDMKITRPIVFEIGPKRTNWRGEAEPKNGTYVIRINTRLLNKVEDFYATAAHELGHVIMWDKFAKAPERVRLQVSEAFKQFREQISAEARTVGDMRRIRDNPISEMTEGRNLLTNGRWSDTIPLSDLTPKSRSYVLHFEEWFAEQVARWATTSEKPLGRIEKFFKDLGTSIRKLVEKFRGERKSAPEATKVMQEWLDSLINDKGKFAHDLLDQLDLDTKRRNADALDRDGTPEVAANPATASTIGGRNILDALPPDSAPAGAATAAHADRMNWFYKWMTSLPQIAELNKHIRPLQIYKEIVATMNVEKNQIMGDAETTRNQWLAIRNPKQQVGIGKFIEDYMNGHFKLVEDGLIRRPTQAEFAALTAKHGLTDQSLRLFDKLVRDFDGLLENYRQLLLADAFRIKDPAAQLKAIEGINKRVDDLLHRPYFPAMRFGKYTITVYDSAGNVRHFEQTETLAKQGKIKEALEKSPDLLPGDRVRTGEVPKDAAPLLGMPPGLIDLMAEKLALSDTQRGMLDQLRFDYAPSQSFRHQFRQKDLTPGYSSDFQRAYAHFFFHGANHLTRIKWVDALRDQTREVKNGSIDLNDANKRDQIANYMTEHLSMLVDPKPDFAALRGLMFHWYLGFNPASATLNLSQTPLMTYPHLASKFGDIKSILALAKAGTELNNFYKKGTIQDLAQNATGPEGAKMRALGEAIKEGVISETQAHTLAAISEGRNLLRSFGTKGETAWLRFSEMSSSMFELAEQYNRRVAFRAAWELAMKDPNNKYALQTKEDNPILYDRLTNPRIGAGMTHQEAVAFISAKDSVEKSQFVYAPYARPKFMWGRKGALFIFKSFTQNTLFNLWSNPSMAARHLLILGAVGGLMGLPGTEDVVGILKALAYKLFGKDFDVEDHARKFAVDVLNGNISPDMLLHGTSVKGFGIPHVMNAIGAQVGLPKFFPTLDRHGSVSMGNILPFEPGKLFGPTKDVKGAELAQLQRASGAGFSNIFAMYNFLSSQQSLSDLKRWEQIMPRAASNLSHAWRYFKEGQERNRAGNAVVRFDVNDTEQMAEILARAAGYQPRRLTGAWEAIQAKQEQATFWDLRKGILLRQFGEAVKGGNADEKASVLTAVKNYNRDLPEEARGKSITSSTLKDSVHQRLRVQAQQERGLPTSKQNYELFKSLDKYFPDGRPTGQVDARPVK